MPAPPLINSFNGGTNGVVIDTSNSGGASGDIFTVAPSIECIFTNVLTHSSPMAMRIVNPTGTAKVVGWDNLGSITGNVYVRFYLNMPALSADNNFYPLGIRTQADAASGALRILSSGNGGVLQMRDASNTQIGSDSAVGVASGQWVRLECRIKSSTTVGEMEYRLFNSPESTVADATGSASGAVLGADTGRTNFGINTATPASFTAYFDDLAVSSVDWIGPLSGATSADNPPIGFIGRGAGW